MHLLILSASAGAGHTQAGRALEEAARSLAPSAEILHSDILAHTSPVYRRAYGGSYLRMIDRAPALWGALYRASNRVRPGGIAERLSRAFDKLEFARFRSFVRGFAPDAVLSTHFLACQVLGPYRRKGRDRFPLGVVVTDFDVHAFCVERTVDRYFVATEELRFLLAAKGIEEGRTAVTGIPISAKFSRPVDRAAVRASLGLERRTPTVLVMSGGAGVGAIEETVKAALERPPVQVLAVAGRNEALRRRLEKLRLPSGTRLRAFGFVDNVHELMAVSDLAVTKSGGLTTSECLAMGLPVLVRDPVPGQEERNADVLAELGAGVKALGPDSLRYKLGSLLADPDRRRQMAEASRRAGRPHAALEIVSAMLS